ncbi:unnamed protein product [Caenorhabditis brenneri]
MPMGKTGVPKLDITIDFVSEKLNFEFGNGPVSRWSRTRRLKGPGAQAKEAPEVQRSRVLFGSKWSGEPRKIQEPRSQKNQETDVLKKPPSSQDLQGSSGANDRCAAYMLAIILLSHPIAFADM